jgi:RNA polymerase sigma factor (sigma-70 family)
MITIAGSNRIFVDKSLNNSKNTIESRDSELVRRIVCADEAALEQLYHHYYPRLFRFIARVIRREELIDEIINDVMYVVWEKAVTYNQECKVSTWIFGIAFNKARQALRSNAGQVANEESLDEIDEDSDWLGHHDRGFHQLEMDDWLGAALGQLSPEHRSVIELTYYEGLHYSEIAEIMACPENTVKTRMYHARKNLAVILNADQDHLNLTN